MRTRRSTCRAGFTLLELMVSVAIIGLLASLMLAAILRVRAVAEDLEARREIVALHNAVASFTTDPRFAVPFIPSQIDPSGTDPVSAGYLRKLFPATGGGLRLPPAQLEGSQCLVLFLGGPAIKNANGDWEARGWATDPLDPTADYGSRIRFYEFNPKRLEDVHGNGYPSYKDRYGTPIVYFSSIRESATWVAPAYTADNQKVGALYTKNPAAGLPPYVNVNPGGFHILSAGRDAKFGQKGAVWTGPTAQTVYPPGDPGHDDLSNFCKNKMGSKQ